MNSSDEACNAVLQDREVMPQNQIPAELQASASDPRLKIPFSVYSAAGGYATPDVNLSALLLTQTLEDTLIARAEFSGCEGCYVEVCRWNKDANQFGAYAFMKCFGSEVGESTDTLKTAMGTAAEIATWINMGAIDPEFPSSIETADRHTYASAVRSLVHRMARYPK